MGRDGVKGIRDDMGAAFGPEAVKGFRAIHEFLDDKATIGVISHEFQQIARSVRDTAAEIAEIIGYAKSFNEWWLGTNKYYLLIPTGLAYRVDSWLELGKFSKADLC